MVNCCIAEIKNIKEDIVLNIENKIAGIIVIEKIDEEIYGLYSKVLMVSTVTEALDRVVSYIDEENK